MSVRGSAAISLSLALSAAPRRGKNPKNTNSVQRNPETESAATAAHHRGIRISPPHRYTIAAGKR